jgi:hypothetical protein
MNKQILLDNLLQQMDLTKAAMDDAELKYEASLREIAEKYGSTFFRNGKWYQVRHRELSPIKKRAFTYLCILDKEPKAWLGKTKDEPQDNEIPDEGPVVVE